MGNMFDSAMRKLQATSSVEKINKDEVLEETKREREKRIEESRTYGHSDKPGTEQYIQKGGTTAPQEAQVIAAEKVQKDHDATYVEPETEVPTPAEKERPDYADTKQYQGGGTEVNRRKPKKRGYKNEGKYIRDFPNSLLFAAQKDLNASGSAKDILAAFVAKYMTDDWRSMNLGEDVAEILKNAPAADSVDLRERLVTLNRKMDIMNNRLYLMELLLSWIITDRLGFRNETVSDPDNADFLEDTLFRVSHRMQQQMPEYRKRMNDINGRRIQ